MSQPAPLPVDDAVNLTQAAWRELAREMKALGKPLPDPGVIPASDFLAKAAATEFTRAQRQTVIAQTRLIFDHLYPHMYYKLSRFQLASPIEILEERVEQHLDEQTALEFHQAMIEVFSFVHDAHTLYGAPPPFRNSIAFLPFQMRFFGDGPVHRFFVTAVMNVEENKEGFGHDFFGPGAEILSWGGLPIFDYVRAVSQTLPGGNFDAQFNRGAQACAIRPLVSCQLPFPREINEGALITYRPFGGGDVRAIRLPWGVATSNGPASLPGAAFSESALTREMTYWDRCLHSRGALWAEKTLNQNDDRQVSKVPEMFQFQFTGGPNPNTPIRIEHLATPERPDARFGYLRIRHFGDGSALAQGNDAILTEFARILSLMDEEAPDGLVLDLRGNSGGDVPLAEHMLQMLTPVKIQPLRFHLANTPAMLQTLRTVQTLASQPTGLDRLVKITAAKSELEPWFDDGHGQPFPEAMEPITSGHTLTRAESIHTLDQVYQGPVVLLVDSFTYSAGDMFTAGFQDHGIGPVIGIDNSTGGGGANVWQHSDLLNNLGPEPSVPVERLPDGVTIRLAIRRCTRRSRSEGKHIEDVGVTVDVLYEPRSADEVVKGYPGLLQRACCELVKAPVWRVNAANAAVQPDGSVTFELRTKGVDGLRFYLDGKLVHEGTITPGAEGVFTAPAAEGLRNPLELTIEGVERVLPPGEHEFPARAVRKIRLRAVEVASAEPPPSLDPDAAAGISA